jgi:RNA polymerase sigma factor (sigma-70 family)
MPEALPRDDSELVALYEREHAPMLRVACLLIGSRDVAEEVVHDAFLTVCERWARLDNPGGYLRATVVNGCRMALRRRTTEMRNAPAGVDGGALDAPTELVELRAALEHLPESYRAVIVLRYFLDLRDYEIAEIIGCREATVRSIVHRAVRALRKELT